MGQSSPYNQPTVPMSTSNVSHKYTRIVNSSNILLSSRIIAMLEATVIDKDSGWMTFNASKSKDIYGNQCVSFAFDFGDGTPPIIVSSPIISRAYGKSGSYTATLGVLDIY